MSLLLLALACATSSTEPPKPPPPNGAPEAPTAAPPAPQATPPAAPAGPPAPTWTPPELPRCSNVRLLTEVGFQELADGAYCKLCGAEDQMACELDWPTSDVPSCAYWDELRNGIYAYYGRPFESDRWKTYFADKPWYKPDPSFTEDRLSEVARANVLVLKQRADGKVGCMD